MKLLGIIWVIIGHVTAVAVFIVGLYYAIANKDYPHACYCLLLYMIMTKAIESFEDKV